MAYFEAYAGSYRNIAMSRENGILEMRFHTDGGPLRWTHIGGAHSELGAAFADVAADPENRLVIMTGTGEAFSLSADGLEEPLRRDTATWDIILRNGMRLIHSLLDIDAPVISCINGPAYRHPEIPLLADIVLCAENAVIQDAGSQYSSERFQRLMGDHGITCSMSRSGNVWDNAAMESFFSSLKTERTARKVYRTRDEARADVFDYIERFYNPKRRHSTIGYLSPVEFENAAMLA